MHKRSFSGDRELARGIARKAAEEMPAYRTLLSESGLLDKLARGGVPFHQLPILDKSGFYLRFPYEDLLAESMRRRMNGVFLSSGSSGKVFFWPRDLAERSAFSLYDWMNAVFAVKGKRTLAVNCLTMDAWNGGANTHLALNALAFDEEYKLTAVSPGREYALGIEAIKRLAAFADLIVIFIHPVAIPYFLEISGTALPRSVLLKFRFATTGDPFPETTREMTDAFCGIRPPGISMASFCYSSADTRLIGTETRFTIALRKLIHSNKKLRARLGFHELVPNLYKRMPTAELPLIEEIGGELVFTRWQPMPLVRYNLHDKGELWDAAALTDLLLKDYPADSAGLCREPGKAPQDDIVVVWGRSKALYFYGIYLDESSLREALSAPPLPKLTTGVFRTEVTDARTGPQLKWTIELSPGLRPSEDLALRFYHGIISELGARHPVFADYRHFSEKWDSDPDRTIMRIELAPFPALSGGFGQKAKHRFIGA